MLSNQLRVLSVNKENEIYFLERLYFSATNYFIFIAKVDFQNPWLSRGNGLPERVWRVWGLIRLKKKKKKSHHMPSLQSVLNQIWLDWGGTVAFPQAVIAILCTLNQVHFEWPKMKEHNQNSHKSVSTDFLFHWNFEGYYWKHYFECSVFKSQLFFIPFRSRICTCIKIEEWVFSLQLAYFSPFTPSCPSTSCVLASMFDIFVFIY